MAFASEGGTRAVTNERNPSGVYWADLFLALLYSGTLILFVAWVGRWELPNPPEVLVKVIGSGWAWVTSAAAAALITAIFRTRLSWLTVVWTIFLTLGLAFSEPLAWFIHQRSEL